MYVSEIILLAYFAYVASYSSVLALAALFYRDKRLTPAYRLRKFAVLIPAYKEDRVIVDIAMQALGQAYPAAHFDVVVIADSLQEATLQTLRSLPVQLVEVSFEKSTKVRALNAAMDVIGDDYDCAVVLDADNIMEPDFLTKMNQLASAGYNAIQGRRDAKNENTSMALLDGLSETINNFIFRQGSVALGMSSSLNGSGMCFDYQAYKDILRNMDSIGGFDRELELKLIDRGMKVHFARNVVVYDEKVPNPEVFERQRRRWISSQFFYLKKYFLQGIKALFRGNITFFNSAVLRNIQLPRLLNLGLLATITVCAFIFRDAVYISPFVWLGLLLLKVGSMALAVPTRLYNLKLLKSILLLPSIFLTMFMLMFRLRGANKSFIHTPHGHVETQHTKAEKV